MTDARIRLAKIIGGGSISSESLSWRISTATADRIIDALHLTPAAALALMEMRATVVPVEPTMKMVQAGIDSFGCPPSWNAMGKSIQFSTAASPYRSDNDAE